MICADELGPVIPRSFPPSPGWSTDGHRIKAPLEYGRGRDKTWVYGALRISDGQAVTLTAPSRDSVGYQQLLAAVEAANPAGEIAVITDNLSSHSSFSTRTWVAGHPRIRQVFIPVGACWLNLISRPRKTLGWKTPAEALNEQLLLTQQGSVATTP